MIIAGLQKLSLVDYPGNIASVVFLQGCNFRCGYCQNPDLVSLEKKFECSEEYVLEFLALRKGMVDGVVISGGEPTIHKQLSAFIKKIRALKFKIKLDTNGYMPEAVEKLLRDRMLDHIAVDIKTSPGKYQMATGVKNAEENVWRTIRTVMMSTVPYEFRTTCVPGIVDADDIREIGPLVKGAGSYYLQQFRPIITLDERFRDVRPYEKAELERMAEILRGYVKNAAIRGA